MCDAGYDGATCDACADGFIATSGGRCEAKKSLGAMCSVVEECLSGFCNGGYCCSVASCGVPGGMRKDASPPGPIGADTRAA